MKTNDLFRVGSELVITDISDREFRVRIIAISNYDMANSMQSIDAISTHYELYKTPKERANILPRNDINKLNDMKFYICETYTPKSDKNTNKSSTSINNIFIFWDEVIKLRECYPITETVEYTLKVDMNTVTYDENHVVSNEALKLSIEKGIKDTIFSNLGHSTNISIEEKTNDEDIFTKFKKSMDNATSLLNELSGLETARQLISDLKSTSTINKIKKIESTLTELYASASSLELDEEDDINEVFGEY